MANSALFWLGRKCSNLYVLKTKYLSTKFTSHCTLSPILFINRIGRTGDPVPTTPPPPTEQNFVNFMQFLEMMAKLHVGVPLPPEGRRSLLWAILNPPLNCLLCRCRNTFSGLKLFSESSTKETLFYYRPQRVQLSACWDTTSPWEAPPPEGRPPGSTSPGRHPMEAHPPRHTPGRRHPAPGIRSMSGRYASCWNAFLFAMLYQSCRDTGKMGNLDFYFSRRGKHKEFA